MAIKESRDIVIEASPEEILDVIADFEAMPEWSDPHQSAKILETGDDGRPSKVKMKVRTAGITDEQVVILDAAKILSDPKLVIDEKV